MPKAVRQTHYIMTTRILCVDYDQAGLGLRATCAIY